MSISKGRLSIALVLIGLGAWQLAINISPEFHNLAYSNQYWPVNIVGFGVFLGLIGLFTWSPGWFVPACIVAGIGGLLYYNNMTGDWSTWVYAWTLIPGFVAAGLLLLGLATWKRGPLSLPGGRCLPVWCSSAYLGRLLAGWRLPVQWEPPQSSCWV